MVDGWSMKIPSMVSNVAYCLQLGGGVHQRFIVFFFLITEF